VEFKVGKQNLDIFLSHHGHEEDHSTTVPETDSIDHTVVAPKIILPLRPDITINDSKNVFQKRLRRSNSQTIGNDLPTRVHDKSSTVVVVPIVDPKPNNSDNTSPINVIIRPATAVSATAASRREAFRNRANSAFGNAIGRPVLARASSVPSRSVVERGKSKFVTTKKRAKSGRSGLRSNGGTKPTEDEDDDSDKRTVRCSMAGGGGGDIETMVSLVSPDESEARIQVRLRRCQ
jgi:hypothetical protein